MKNLAIILSLTLLSFTVSAQRGKGGGFHGRGPVYRPAVTVRAYAPLYPYYSPFYDPYYYPYYNVGNSYRYPARLEMKLDAIRDDYKQQIKETRHDKSRAGKERRQKVRELKTEKDRALVDAKRDYFKNIHA